MAGQGPGRTDTKAALVTLYILVFGSLRGVSFRGVCTKRLAWSKLKLESPNVSEKQLRKLKITRCVPLPLLKSSET
jgi:hypothetical protein